MRKGQKKFVWVKGHSGIRGNEEADIKAAETVEIGKQLQKPDIATPAGIRQAFPLHRKSKYLK